MRWSNNLSNVTAIGTCLGDPGARGARGGAGLISRSQRARWEECVESPRVLSTMLQGYRLQFQLPAPFLQGPLCHRGGRPGPRSCQTCSCKQQESSDAHPEGGLHWHGTGLSPHDHTLAHKKGSGDLALTTLDRGGWYPCQRLLGLLTSASLLIPLGLRHLLPLHRWFNSRRLHPSTSHHQLRVMAQCLGALLRWSCRSFLSGEVEMLMMCHQELVSTDASQIGWGGVTKGRSASGCWLPP